MPYGDCMIKYMKEIKINHLDLFSGIGGFHLGFQRAGFKINSYFSEIDKYAIKVYKHRFKNSNYVGSVTDVYGRNLPNIDLITFGSPCQDFSIAGKRKGLKGKRSSLIGEAIRLIREKRPSVFVWENVKGTFSSNNGKDFTAILQAFTNIGGYRLEWQLLNTKWFLPQNRERIYLVGYIAKGSGGQIFPIGKNNKQTDELQKQQGNTCTITTRYRAAESSGSYIIKRKLNTQEIDIIDKRGSLKNKNIASTIVAGYAKNPSDADYIKINSATTKGYEIATCNQAIIKSTKIRRLTPIECERLQGFPDDWTKEGTNGKISDSQRYKMCGNAVTVDVVQAVAKRIKQVVYG